MKFDVKFSCGHNETVQLFGKMADRYRRIEYYEQKCVCSKCYAEKKRIDQEVKAQKEGLEAVEMLYREYKLNYPDAKTVPGSYNGETKTIKVWLKKEVEV